MRTVRSVLTRAARFPRSLRCSLHLALFTGLALAVAASVILLVYSTASTSLRNEIRSHLAGFAAATASQVDAAQLAHIRASDEEGAPAHEALRAQLLRVKASYPAVHRIFIMAEQDDEPQFYTFLVDTGSLGAATDDDTPALQEQAARVGERYDISHHPEMRLALEQPVADREPRTDRYGSWLTAYAPVYDNYGHPIAMIGVNVSVDDLVAQEADLKRMASFAFIALVALIVVVAALYSQRDALRVEKERYYRQVQELSNKDALTELWTRRRWTEHLRRELSRAIRFNHSLAVVMVDCDGLKPLNDRFGHQCGDQLLCHVALLIKTSIRDTDTAARYGGDEFMILLPETDQRAAQSFAGRLQEKVSHSRLFWAGEEIAPSISMGIATFPVNGVDEDALYAYADAAMYAAKRAKRASLPSQVDVSSDRGLQVN